MNGPVLVGLTGVVIGGILNGTFAAPMKSIRTFAWENTWLVYSVVGLLVIPWLIAFITVPHLLVVLRETPWTIHLIILAFGAGWGVGSVLFGLGIRRMGLAVGYGMIVGLNAPFGTLLPLIALHRDRLSTPAGHALLRGTALVLFGIVFCALAANLRERRANYIEPIRRRTELVGGLMICVLSGLFSPMINFSFIMGAVLQENAKRAGASPGMAATAIWAVALTSGFLVNAGYCLMLLCKNRTFERFRLTHAGDYRNATLMGLLCFASFVVYGAGATALGALGGVVGWPVFLSMSLIASSLFGAFTGEWKGAPRSAYGCSLAGIAILIAAVTLIGRSGIQ